MTPANQQSLRESSASIKQILGQENQRKALEAYGKDYRERWKSQTKCRDEFVIGRDALFVTDAPADGR